MFLFDTAHNSPGTEGIVCDYVVRASANGSVLCSKYECRCNRSSVYEKMKTMFASSLHHNSVSGFGREIIHLLRVYYVLTDVVGVSSLELSLAGDVIVL